MLMQNFKSAADLGITEPQLSALMKTLVLLETDALQFVPVSEDDDGGEESPTFCSNFNMRFWSLTEHRCGTVACIGGTAELIGDVKFSGWVHNNGLNDLFWPIKHMNHSRIAAVTPAQAATALRSYLTTGDAKWDEAVRT
jgi:hypothetical protein